MAKANSTINRLFANVQGITNPQLFASAVQTAVEQIEAASGTQENLAANLRVQGQFCLDLADLVDTLQAEAEEPPPEDKGKKEPTKESPKEPPEKSKAEGAEQDPGKKG